MKIAILGIGNVLACDDGFGIYAIKVFDSLYATAANVEVIELGTPGLDMVPHLTGYDAVILLDTVRVNAEPGSVHIFEKDQILKNVLGQRANAHDPSLKGTLQLMEAEGTCPAQMMLVGVVPERIETGTELSDVVRAAVPVACAHVEVQLAMWGYPPGARTEPRVPDIWWERTAATI